MVACRLRSRIGTAFTSHSARHRPSRRWIRPVSTALNLTFRPWKHKITQIPHTPHHSTSRSPNPHISKTLNPNQLQGALIHKTHEATSRSDRKNARTQYRVVFATWRIPGSEPQQTTAGSSAKAGSTPSPWQNSARLGGI
jgi:hypothetical protein